MQGRGLAKALVTLASLAVLVGCASTADIADDAAHARTTAGGASPTDERQRPTAPPDPTESTAPSPGEQPIVPDDAALEAGRSEPVEDPYYPTHSNPEIDVLHYFLDLDWDGSVLAGRATVTFRPATDTEISRLDLASGLSVRSVTLDGAPVDFAQAGDGLEIETDRLDVDSTHTLRIDYSGSPEPTPAPSMRSDMAQGLGWTLDRQGNVYTFQEPYGGFTWYPVNDHPSDEALYDARITTQGSDIAVFNGELVEQVDEVGSSTMVWHVDEPMASYLATIAIGPYTEVVDEAPGGLPISYWVMPRDRDLVDRLVSDADAALPWLEEHIGPYPFSSLGVVVVGGDSGMETQTMVTMSRGAVLRPDAVLLHEFAHMWFGNSVSPTDWQGMWLNEGFAMYVQQWFERDTGMPVYGGGVARWREYDNQSRLVAGPPGDYDPAWFGDGNVYLGPAMMLDRIRQRIGDSAFEDLVRAWAREFGGQHVDRATFTSWVNEQTGQDLTALIDLWLDSPRTPR